MVFNSFLKRTLNVKLICDEEADEVDGPLLK